MCFWIVQIRLKILFLVKFFFNRRMLFLMKSDRNLFFTEIDLCNPGVILGFDLNFNLYLLIFLKGVKLSNNLWFCLKISRWSSQYFLSPFSVFHSNRWKNKNKVFLIKTRPISLINIGLVGRRCREYVRNY